MRFPCILAFVCILPVAVYTWNRNCISKPVGFGYKTTGGQGGKTVTPKNINELKNYLASNEKLIINLDKTYDFTQSENMTQSTGCFFQAKSCADKRGYQQSLAQQGTCNGMKPATVKYWKAGTTEMIVGSYKTIMSSNGKGVIKGKGLRIKNAKNVIIRDITISDINPQVIWAGDALVFDNVENVWIHKCTFARVGRQFLVTMQRVNKGITVSSCLFDGTSSFTAYCDKHHFWVWIFFGTRDEITLINNRVLNSAGRTPHTGGWGGSQNYIHMVGNALDNNLNTGIEARHGAYILAEANVFSNFKSPIDLRAKGGYLAMVNTAKEASICKTYFGQICKVNKFSKSPAQTRFDAQVLQAFSKLDKNAINGARNSVCV